MSKIIDYSQFVGQKFGHLVFVEVLPIEGKHKKAMVKCICGNIFVAYWDNVRRGLTKSCGCKRFPTGETVNHPLQKIWVGIKQRCYNPKSQAYAYYGGKGVKMCDEWKNNFKSFYEWCMANGWERGLEVDKDLKGNGKIYSPDWCTITTHRENTLAIKRKPKLTIETANEILNSPLSGRKLAKEMKLTRHVITEVRNNKYWQKYRI